MLKKVAVIMGSASDLPTAEKAVSELIALKIPAECRVISAHRTPETAAAFAEGAEAEGFGVIIAAAGKAAHLAGALAARTSLPVIGIPLKGSALDGLDALLSTVQMPDGVPVASVAIDGARNAAILAAQILALADADLSARLKARRAEMRDDVAAKDAEMQKNLNKINGGGN